jgi:serine/threonine protein kinase
VEEITVLPRTTSSRDIPPLPNPGGANSRQDRSSWQQIQKTDGAASRPSCYNRGNELVPGFRLLQFLGKGGFGEVWKASAPGRTEVALKLISLETKQGFNELRAIRMIKGIHHAHLIPIVAYWLKDRDGHLFMEGLNDSTNWKSKGAELIIEMGLGEKNLLDRLHECADAGLPGVPPDELLNYLEDAAQAIDYLNKPIHNLGSGPVAVQHGDIKPQNLMIVGGSVQVCDFGLARILGDARGPASGLTIPYTPPELFSQNKPSASSDQYSLAITYVELRTGGLPFETFAPGHVIYAHLLGKLNLSRLPPAEAEVIRRATALDPTARFPTAGDMVRALRKAYTGARSPEYNLSPPVDLLQLGPETELVPGYSLVKLIGKGGFGEVWEAVAPGGKHVALKIVKNLRDRSGKQEFKALELIKSVEHNHLLELHAYWLLDDKGRVIPDRLRQQSEAPAAEVLVIASTLACKNLAQRLKECLQQGRAGIPLPELFGYMRQAAQAIDYLNKPQHLLDGRPVSIQHRDIKPENILLAADTVKVGDFGLAKEVEGTEAEIRRDSEGITLGYAAPEVFENRVTAWSDQYSLAVTYYRLRTGAWPFLPGHSLLAQLQQKTAFRLLPEEERAVLVRATAIVAEQRFPTCSAMVEALEKACAESLDAEELRSEKLALTEDVPVPAERWSKDSLAESQAAPLPVLPSSRVRAVEPAVVSVVTEEPGHLFDTVVPSSWEVHTSAGDIRVQKPTSLPSAPASPLRPVKLKPKNRAWKSPFRLPKKWLVAGMAILTIGLVAAGVTALLRSWKDSLDQEIRPLIAQEQYQLALTYLETVGFPELLFRCACREEVRTVWLAHLQNLAAKDTTGNETFAEAEKFLNQFPGDQEADTIRAQALRKAKELHRKKRCGGHQGPCPAGDRRRGPCQNRRGGENQ